MSIKLLFSYCKNIIYFVAIDKDAVTKAIAKKYRNIIKADEALEKVFSNNKFANIITEFFKEIKFTNPRHIKKILNKSHTMQKIYITFILYLKY